MEDRGIEETHVSGILGGKHGNEQECFGMGRCMQTIKTDGGLNCRLSAVMNFEEARAAVRECVKCVSATLITGGKQAAR